MEAMSNLVGMIPSTPGLDEGEQGDEGLLDQDDAPSSPQRQPDPAPAVTQPTVALTAAVLQPLPSIAIGKVPPPAKVPVEPKQLPEKADPGWLSSEEIMPGLHGMLSAGDGPVSQGVFLTRMESVMRGMAELLISRMGGEQDEAKAAVERLEKEKAALMAEKEKWSSERAALMAEKERWTSEKAALTADKERFASEKEAAIEACRSVEASSVNFQNIAKSLRTKEMELTEGTKQMRIELNRLKKASADKEGALQAQVAGLSAKVQDLQVELKESDQATAVFQDVAAKATAALAKVRMGSKQMVAPSPRPVAPPVPSAKRAASPSEGESRKKAKPMEGGGPGRSSESSRVADGAADLEREICNKLSVVDQILKKTSSVDKGKGKML